MFLLLSQASRQIYDLPPFSTASTFSSRQRFGTECHLGWAPSALLTCAFSLEKQKAALSVDADIQEREEGRGWAAGYSHMRQGRGRALKSVTCPDAAGDGEIGTSGWQRQEGCQALATGV